GMPRNSDSKIAMISQTNALLTRSKPNLWLIPPLFRPLAAAPLANPQIWIGLAWLDIVNSYRRTMLGPAWITLNLIIFTIAMTLVYGALFSVPTKEYSGYLLCGMMVWLWISALLNEVGNTFILYGHFL